MLSKILSLILTKCGNSPFLSSSPSWSTIIVVILALISLFSQKCRAWEIIISVSWPKSSRTKVKDLPEIWPTRSRSTDFDYWPLRGLKTDVCLDGVLRQLLKEILRIWADFWEICVGSCQKFSFRIFFRNFGLTPVFPLKISHKKIGWILCNPQLGIHARLRLLADLRYEGESGDRRERARARDEIGERIERGWS